MANNDGNNNRCDCCVDRVINLSLKDKHKLKKSGLEFQDNPDNILPALDEETKRKIKEEKAKDIAEAFMLDEAGINQRIVDIVSKFKDVGDKFEPYFSNKKTYAKDLLDYDKESKGKALVCEKVIDKYLIMDCQDKEKVVAARLKGENDEKMIYLSKDAYETYKGAIGEHERALELANKSEWYVYANESKLNIDKDLYKKDIPVIDPSNQDEPAIDPSNQDEPVIDSSDEDKANESESENTAKRKKSLEDEELNPDSVKKPKRDDSDSDSDSGSKVSGLDGGSSGMAGGPGGTGNGSGQHYTKLQVDLFAWTFSSVGAVSETISTVLFF